MSEEQFKELDNLDIHLSRYKGGVREFKKIINRVNSDDRIIRFRAENKSTDKQACWEVMKKYVEPGVGMKQDEIFERYFTVVPYLNNAFKRYWEELKNNPLSKTTIEAEILNYNVK